ncbi:hypothetical protein BH11PAT1_BH11PAT1_5580 [soil metagenome]
MKNLSALDWIALILVLIGGLNWGLVGLFNFNLVGAILGDMSLLSRIIYAVVGISTVYVAAIAMKLGKKE